MDQHAWVRGCLAHYQENEITPEPGWQEAHYPIPECLGGNETVWLTFDHHQQQGLLQSEEHQCACFYSGDVKKFLDRNPTRLDLWDLYDKWAGYNANAMNDHPNTVANRTANGRKTGPANAVANLTPHCSANGAKTGAENVKTMRDHPNSVEGRIKGGKAMNDHPNTKENRAKTGRVTGVINAERNLLPNCSSNGKSSSKKTNAQRWLCLATGHVSTPSGLSSWQIKRGIDTSLRKRLN